jgi:hypothetical protein
MPKNAKLAAATTKPAAKTAPAKQAEDKKKLEKVNETVVFWCNDGQIFRDMKDLMDGFERMSESTFAYHLNDTKNDFSCWVLDIIGDQKLAQDLKTVKNRDQARKRVQQRYAEITQWEG